MMREIEKEVAERFSRDVAKHVMTVELNNGVHRCLHFAQPGKYAYSFRVLTWPGYLYIGGDCEDFVFARVRDMFEYFRTDRGRVNLSYWSQKLTASAKGRGYQEYSADRFREAIEHDLQYRLEELNEDERVALRERVSNEVLSYAEDGEHAARQAARDFEHDGDQVFTDFWETDLNEYTYGFVWACHAIVWAIQQYDAVITPDPTAADVLFPGLEYTPVSAEYTPAEPAIHTTPIRSGDRIATGTGPARRRLTVAEAEAGGLPEPFTPDEWRAMAQASRGAR